MSQSCFILKDLCKIIIYVLIYKLQDVLEFGWACCVCRWIPKSVMETERELLAARVPVFGAPEGGTIIRMWFVGRKCCTQAGNGPPRRQVIPILCASVLTGCIELQTYALVFLRDAGYVISGNYPCIIMIMIITIVVCRLYTQSKMENWQTKFTVNELWNRKQWVP